MLRKILIAALAVAMLGGVVMAAVSFAAPSEEGQRGRAVEAVDGVYGRGRGQTVESETEYGLGQGGGRNSVQQSSAGRGNGQGRAGQGESVVPPLSNPEASLVEQYTFTGIIVAQDEEMALELEDGSVLELGLGPTFYREDQGFAGEIGDTLSVTGFYEDDEFKVISVTDDSGLTTTFRDEYGRPMWSGRGRMGA